MKKITALLLAAVMLAMLLAGSAYADGESYTVSTRTGRYTFRSLIGKGFETGMWNVNGDGKENIKDVVLLMKYISGEAVTIY